MFATSPISLMRFSYFFVLHQIAKTGDLISSLASVRRFLDESWTDTELAIDGYSLVRADRTYNSGDGLLVFIPSHISFKRRVDLEFEGIEAIWLELLFHRSSPCFACFIYRRPSSTSAYIALLDEISQQVMVLGDLNFDLLERPLPAPTKQYLSIFDSLGYQQLITKSTRPISNSLLDHIFVSSSDFVIEADTISNTASDHLPIFVAWKLKAGYTRPTGHKVLRFRSRKNFCIESFMHDLSLVPWSTLDIYDDVNDALDQWYKLFNDILTVHAPIKEHRIKRPCCSLNKKS
ncbi:predicted protein [Nematostella vectensis]|uniref:Endonuclease/exonuclease/phosphatase domain-containing protein n=1 Tax=Nematostella vectensis TaxID=45351 RepID=A7SL96_NEMVE|nr:predicted protein [Nematostella vectensis]|eukprot:XP_001627633.1 predicted protein [Nematostella vectensis]